MQAVDAQKWVVLGTNGGAVLMEAVPGGTLHHFPPGLLPDDLRPGDSFRVVARTDRRADADPEHAASGDAPRAREEG